MKTVKYYIFLAQVILSICVILGLINNIQFVWFVLMGYCIGWCFVELHNQIGWEIRSIKEHKTWIDSFIAYTEAVKRF